MAQIYPELDVMAACGAQLAKLDVHARARVLLWLLRKHQSSGGLIDVAGLERQAVQPNVVAVPDPSKTRRRRS